jgi:hypothetical protein
MKKNLNIYFLIFIIILITIVFKNWFFANIINSGDLLFASNAKDISLYPFAWGNSLNGLGSQQYAYLWVHFLMNTPLFILVHVFGLSSILVEKISFFYLWIVLSVISITVLFRKIFSNNKFYLLSPIIFLFNTYVLMLVGGGQIFIALSLAFIPVTLYFADKVINSNLVNDSFLALIKKSFLLGIILTIQVMLDLRIGYIALCAVMIYLLLFNLSNLDKRFFLKTIFVFSISLIVVVLLDFYWILPLISVGQNPITQLGTAYSTTSGVIYFSFAKLENSFSLLHPNWPENIFGKIGFMKPEFSLLPFLAFSSLLFISKIKDQRTKIYILYFALIGLLGVFLAKGANEPFGVIYLWMFDHFPGMQMFRDPTKWYTLIVVSYSMLMPFSIWKTYEWIKTYNKFSIFNFQFSIKNKFFNSQNLFLLIIVFCLLYLIHPALLGKLTGTFKSTVIPNEYVRLSNYLSSQNNFSRTFWVPTTQRFGFSSNNHSTISAASFFQLSDNPQIIKKLRSENTEKLLQESGVKYVIIPFDSEDEIFLDDRRYSEKAYLNTIKEINSIPWLKKMDGFGKIAVYEVPNPKDHFWSASKTLSLQYKFLNPVEYTLNIKNAKKGDRIIFSESYDSRWIARDISGEHKNSSNPISSSRFDKIYNSFVLSESGNYALSIYYYPQLWVNIGMIFSISSIFLIFGFILFGYRFRKW